MHQQHKHNQQHKHKHKQTQTQTTNTNNTLIHKHNHNNNNDINSKSNPIQSKSKSNPNPNPIQSNPIQPIHILPHQGKWHLVQKLSRYLYKSIVMQSKRKEGKTGTTKITNNKQQTPNTTTNNNKTKQQEGGCKKSQFVVGFGVLEFAGLAAGVPLGLLRSTSILRIDSTSVEW